MKLKNGWLSVRLGDALEVIRGISFPKDAKQSSYKNGLVACLRTANVQKEVDWDDLWFVSEEFVSRDEQFLRVNDILISTANSFELLGKVSMVNQVLHRATLGTFIVNLRTPKELNPRFVYYYLSSKRFQNHVRENASTTTNISNISSGKLREIQIEIAPLPEQRAIVAKIETLFSELDNGTEQLKTAQQQLKVYRQAVLKQAFEGKLTEHWRSHQSLHRTRFGGVLPTADVLLSNLRIDRIASGKVSKPVERIVDADVNDLPVLPTGWCWVRLADLCPTDRKCAYGVLVPGDHVSDGVPIVRVGDIDEKGSVDISSIKKIDPKIAGKFKRTFLQGGEVLITLVGAIGRTAVAPLSLKGFNTARAVGVVPLERRINPKYVEIMLRSPGKQQQHNSDAHEVARKTLNLEDVEKTILPLCSEVEQEQIVQEIETRLSVCDKLEETITQNLHQAEALRQSILKQAFEGNLLTQEVLAATRKEANWEPAAKLLERIRHNEIATKPIKKQKLVVK